MYEVGQMLGANDCNDVTRERANVLQYLGIDVDQEHVREWILDVFLKKGPETTQPEPDRNLSVARKVLVRLVNLKRVCNVCPGHLIALKGRRCCRALVAPQKLSLKLFANFLTQRLDVRVPRRNVAAH
jgi:hypothetical protein